MQYTVLPRTKTVWRLILLITLASFSLLASSATIQVTAQIGEAGCDLADAIRTANNNSPTGGCIANNGSFVAGERDLIVLNFDAPISEFIVSSVNGFSNGLPSIRTDIEIRGRGEDKVTIKRSEALSTPEFRLLTVIEGGRLSLNNISMQNGMLSADPGGAIQVQGGLLEIINSEFVNNQSSNGGAIYMSNSDDNTVIIQNTLFSGNSAIVRGGAITNPRGELTIINSEFIGNQTMASGGAISISGATTTLVSKTLFVENDAAQTGGAISVRFGGTTSIYDSTISNNRANTDRFAYGGGVALSGDQFTLSITNTTITDNVSNRGGGIGFDRLNSFEDSFFRLINSLITGNSSNDSLGAGVEINSGAMPINSFLQNNLIGNSSITRSQAISGSNLTFDSSTIFSTSDGNRPSSLNNILLPLANNGGLTRTHALAANSPAINAATDGTVVQAFFTFYVPGCRGQEISPATPLPAFRSDQRGAERPIDGACDIGSYETEASDDCFVVRAANDNVVAFCL